MSIERYRDLIEHLVAAHGEFARKAVIGKRYYENDNDIRRFSGLEELRQAAKLQHNPLRSADFRISHNWHQLLVNQKAAYLFTWPPTFDCGDAGLNQRISEALGQDFARVIKNLAVEASNCGVGWLFCWVDENGRFCYADVPAEQVIPVYGQELAQPLQAVLRLYHLQDEEGDCLCYELWNEREVAFFRKRDGRIEEAPQDDCGSHILSHSFGAVPFVPFYNNGSHMGDLPMYKDLIDQYDRVVSGYANDLFDIQEVIFVLRNYGGEDLATFLSELKRYKAVKVDGDSPADGGIETMQIDIPIEARVKFLELLKKQIFISGQGVDPDPAKFGNASGVALKYLYSLLEIKAGLMETEFRSGFERLLRTLLRFWGLDEHLSIRQIYTRNCIENDLETAQIAKDSLEIISHKSILQNHPWVEDAEAEARAIGLE